MLAAPIRREVQIDGRVRYEPLEYLDPRHALDGLVHTGFCGENMVIDRHGRLRLVDNEHVCVGPLGFDPGRSWCRWGLPAALCQRFRAVYAAHAPFTEPLDAFAFWSLVAAVVGVEVRQRTDRARVHVSLAVLRHRLADMRATT